MKSIEHRHILQQNLIRLIYNYLRSLIAFQEYKIALYKKVRQAPQSKLSEPPQTKDSESFSFHKTLKAYQKRIKKQ